MRKPQTATHPSPAANSSRNPLPCWGGLRERRPGHEQPHIEPRPPLPPLIRPSTRGASGARSRRAVRASRSGVRSRIASGRIGRLGRRACIRAARPLGNAFSPSGRPLGQSVSPPGRPLGYAFSPSGRPLGQAVAAPWPYFQAGANASGPLLADCSKRRNSTKAQSSATTIDLLMAIAPTSFGLQDLNTPPLARLPDSTGLRASS